MHAADRGIIEDALKNHGIMATVAWPLNQEPCLDITIERDGLGDEQKVWLDGFFAGLLAAGHHFRLNGEEPSK